MASACPAQGGVAGPDEDASLCAETPVGCYVFRMVAELCVRPSTAGKLGEALGWNREGRLRQGSRAGSMTIAGCSGTVGSE